MISICCAAERKLQGETIAGQRFLGVQENHRALRFGKLSESHSYSGKWIHIIGGMSDTNVAAAIELHVFVHQIFESDVHRADPSRAAFGADTAEELTIAAQLADDGVIECHHIRKLFVVIAIAVISQKIHFGLQSHVPISRNFTANGKITPPSTASLPR